MRSRRRRYRTGGGCALGCDGSTLRVVVEQADSQPAGVGDFRAYLPRFTGDNLIRNQQLVTRLKEIADDKGITQVQLVVAWALHKNSSIVPVM